MAKRSNPKVAQHSESSVAISAEQLDTFTDLIRSGNAIKGAVALLWLDNSLSGVAALKHPSEDYRQHISSASAVTLDQRDFPIELAFVLAPEAKVGNGHCCQLLESVLYSHRKSGTFAVVSSKDKRRSKALLSSGFQKFGTPFQLGSPGERSQLFLRLAPERNRRM